MKKKGQAQLKRQKRALKVALACKNLKDAGTVKDSTSLETVVQPLAGNETLGVVEDNSANQANNAKETVDEDDKQSKSKNKRKSGFEANPTSIRKKIRSTTAFEASKGYQSHAEYWESLIAAGRKVEKVRPQGQAHIPGPICVVVNAAAKDLHSKEKMREQALLTDCAEKQILTQVEVSNSSGAAKEKSILYRCEPCSRKFSTGYALDQHNEAKHR